MQAQTMRDRHGSPLRTDLSCLLFMLMMGTARAEELVLAVHPVLPREGTIESFQPLADYLGEAVGHRVRLTTAPNFLVHWQLTKRGEHQLVLDGPHFTDYRIREMGYDLLAKYPDVVSYTLVAHEDLLILEPGELIGKPIATLPSPALGALRLAEIYPNPLRQPDIIETRDSLTAVEQVMSGQAAGAIIPAPLVRKFPALVTVVSTGQVPAPALSAAPSVPEEIRAALRKALLDAQNTDSGKRALKSINIAHFELARSADYAGQAELLRGTWGY